nr:hypothetical protein CFP56_44227 [Quercus suber]
MEPEFQQANQRSSEEDAELEKSAFRFERVDEPEEESDTELDELVEGMVDVKLSQETKSCMRAPWTKALIVKVYGQTVGYSYLTFKLNTLWKPVAKMDCVDLGKDFYLIKLKLPIEFYDPLVLREVGLSIGPVLRIDSYTASGTRASFARLIGHKHENCGFRVSPMEKTTHGEPAEKQRVQQTAPTKLTDHSDPNFDDWMIVTKKKNLVRSGRNRGSNQPHQQPNGLPKVSKGKEVNSSTLSPSNPDLTFQFKSGPSIRAVDEAVASDKTLPSKKFGEVYTPSKHGDCRKEKQSVSQTSASNTLSIHYA